MSSQSLVLRKTKSHRQQGCDSAGTSSTNAERQTQPTTARRRSHDDCCSSTSLGKSRGQDLGRDPASPPSLCFTPDHSPPRVKRRAHKKSRSSSEHLSLQLLVPEPAQVYTVENVASCGGKRRVLSDSSPLKNISKGSAPKRSHSHGGIASSEKRSS